MQTFKLLNFYTHITKSYSLSIVECPEKLQKSLASLHQEVKHQSCLVDQVQLWKPTCVNHVN